MADPSRRNVTILGSTGSIGASTLDVIARHPERFSVMALAANRQWAPLLAQIARGGNPETLYIGFNLARKFY